MSTLAEKWIEEGEKKGIERGRREAYRELVRRQIELKFGALDSVTVARLESADEGALTRYVERVLTATRVEEVWGE